MILDAENRSETIKKEITIEAKEEAHRMKVKLSGKLEKEELKSSDQRKD
jgi:ribonuclease Y